MTVVKQAHFDGLQNFYKVLTLLRLFQKLKISWALSCSSNSPALGF